MWGVVPSSNGNLEESEKDIPKLKNHPLFEGMLVCHSLTIIDNELCGDPLDVKVIRKHRCFLFIRKTLIFFKYKCRQANLFFKDEISTLVFDRINFKCL